MKLQRLSAAALRKRRRQLVRELPPMEQVLRGTLVETYKRCGRPNCHCVDGPGHGPKRYLCISRLGARPRRDYVPNNVHLRVAELIDNLRRIRDMLRHQLWRAWLRRHVARYVSKKRAISPNSSFGTVWVGS
jgi:hypothetical protein